MDTNNWKQLNDLKNKSYVESETVMEYITSVEKNRMIFFYRLL